MSLKLFVQNWSANKPTINRAVAVFILCTLLGLIFSKLSMPRFLLVFTACYTSFVELIAGFLLIIGLFRNYTLYALDSVLLIVAFGHGWKDGIWDLQHVVFRTALLVAILLLPEAWDKWQIERYFKKGS